MPLRFVDTTTDERLVTVYEKHVRFNNYIQSGERKIYIDAMKARGMNIEKYLKDVTETGKYQEQIPLVTTNMEGKIHDQVASLIELR